MAQTKYFFASYRSAYALVGLVALIPFTWLQVQYFILPRMVEISTFKRGDPATLADWARLMCVPLLGYALLSSVFILITLVFKPLKPLPEKGLLHVLTVGFITGFLGGSLLGLIGGSLVELATGLLYGLTMMLTTMLPVALAAGLPIEFSKQNN